MRRALLLFLITMTCHAGGKIHEYVLDNGLKLIVKEDHRAPVAVTMIWYKIGSADEPSGITGVSHALEHMMFKGTPRYPMGTFSKTIASIGGQENAFTNYDYTAYYEKVAAIQLPVTFELEADRMANLLLDKQEFAKENKVIQEERRLRTDNNPQALAFERYMASAYLAVPYHNPVIGWMNDIQQLNITDLRAWYANFYAPNNATLVVIGDVKPEKVYDLARLYFGNLTKKPELIRKKQEEPRALGPKVAKISAPAKLPMLAMGYSVPSVKSAKNLWEPYALELVAGILDAGESARFAKDLLRGKQIASSAGVYYDLYTRYPSQFMLFGIPSQNHSMDDLKKAMLAQIQALQKTPVGADELERIKKQIIAQKTFERDSIFTQAMEIGILETIGLGFNTAERYADRINQVTPAQIQEVANRYLKQDQLTEVQLTPVSQPEVRQ